ncbi:energy-coupling factor transporter transmembrane protein EcfT [Pseudorhizobium halotolerans]|uniref:Energy-coupling factor transporter transmembrane protein EcfT n=1 Tax=Pseudorhizobium halotolerans TaxID=1233081 RepID=A0ABN7K3G8_9HYPH|nr:energy-coupling factor transporter transmembrane protein EcfT [Pseudorhizobium halotolerans]CAD7056682.1 energy-coupling factor transporter transmembrane protein EcfT [Pseudorhizobium halotolerans]
MNSLYIQGRSLLHQLSAGPKLILVLVVSLAVFLTRSPLILGASALAGFVLYASTGIGVRAGWIRLRPILLTIVVVALATVLLGSVEEGMVALLRLTTLMLVAAAVTATTPVGAFIDVVSRAARPLERLGFVRADDIGLAVGLVIRFVPEVLSRYDLLKQAHRARGLKLRPTTVLAPLTIQTLKAADEIAAAIDARGIRGHKHSTDS